MKLYSCCVCKEKKSVRSFNKDSGRRTGIASRCRRCLSVRDNKGRYQKRRSYFIEYQANYKRKFPEKISARQLVKKAIETKELVKQDCVVCGSEDSRAHHPDYSKPLDVIWFCQKHHQQEHRRLKLNPPSH